MTTLREAAQQALEALEFYYDQHGEESDAKVIAALRAALAEPVTNQCGETCERAKLCAVCARGLAEPPDSTKSVAESETASEPVQESLTIERLRDALVASRIISPAAVEDPDEYDDGVTLFRIEALHRRIT